MKNMITITGSNGTRYVPADAILKLEGARNYTVFYQKNGEQHVESKCIGDVMKRFSTNEDLKEKFFRVNRSTVVNLNEVKLYKQGRGGTLVLSNEAMIAVAYRRKAELLRVLHKRK
jgi:two-component system LytT family response regulator